MRILSNRFKQFVSLLSALLLLAVVGCIPDEVWLADSSGFVYQFQKSESTREFRFYDLSKKAERTIWSGSTSAGRVIDPSEQLLYLAEPKGEGGSWSCRLSATNVKTNRVVRTTKWIPWEGLTSEKSMLWLERVPGKAGYFLVSDTSNTGPAQSAILNADAESLVPVPGFMLDVIPDGSGFLATNRLAVDRWEESLKANRPLTENEIESLCREALCIVDLEGFRYRLDWDTAALGVEVTRYRELAKKAQTAPKDEYYPGLMWGKETWLGYEARVPKSAGSGAKLINQEIGALRIDPAKRKVGFLSVDAIPAEPAAARTMNDDGSRLLAKLKDVEYWARILEQPTDTKPYYVAAIEIHWPAQGRVKTLANRVLVWDTSSETLSSPNGLYAVLKYEEPKKEGERGSLVHYIIVDNNGNILDKLSFRNME